MSVNINCDDWGERDCDGSLPMGGQGTVWTSWDKINAWAKDVAEGRWLWAYNTRCKYVSFRMDTRFGRCVIKDRDNNTISYEQLIHQNK